MYIRKCFNLYIYLRIICFFYKYYYLYYFSILFANSFFVPEVVTLYIFAIFLICINVISFNGLFLIIPNSSNDIIFLPFLSPLKCIKNGDNNSTF